MRKFLKVKNNFYFSKHNKKLKYYYELLERIPRKEIEEFHKLFTENFNDTFRKWIIK